MTNETREVLEDVRSGKLQAWWNLDTYLVAHLAELLTKLRDEGHGYPGQFAKVEDWNDQLTNLIEALELYDTDSPIAYANAQGALHYIAAHLNYFWD